MMGTTTLVRKRHTQKVTSMAKATDKQDHAADTPAAPTDSKPDKARRVERPFPRRSLEQALTVPMAIKVHNGGNPWTPDQVATAVDLSPKGNAFFYLTSASRTYGFTEGTRDAAAISLTDLGRAAVAPQTLEEQADAVRKAFFSVEVFQRVVDHFGGSKLPEKPFLTNTLEATFGLDPEIHDEFIEIFESNCRMLGIGADYDPASPSQNPVITPAGQVRTVVVPADGSDKVCFIIMPFTERDDSYPIGFFDEVLESLFKPALEAAGFIARTAKRQGSDVIQATIVNELLDADIVLADLTAHNPNVLFELGMRMHMDKPVALVRAKGTGPIFDVDHLLRVQDYNANLWRSTVEKDVVRISKHVLATWENRGNVRSYMTLLKETK